MGSLRVRTVLAGLASAALASAALAGTAAQPAVAANAPPIWAWATMSTESSATERLPSAAPRCTRPTSWAGPRSPRSWRPAA
jgi:hypothetical protein